MNTRQPAVTILTDIEGYISAFVDEQGKRDFEEMKGEEKTANDL
jgi:hypothetical protein